MRHQQGRKRGSKVVTTESVLQPPRIAFLEKSPFFGVVSVLLVVVSLFVIFTKGLNYGIDFAGGTEMQVQFSQAISTEEVRTALSELGLGSLQVQSFGEEQEYLIRFETTGDSDEEINTLITERTQKVGELLSQKFADSSPNVRRTDSVGPQVGNQLKRDGILAVFYSLLLILIYVGLRFDYSFAPGAVACLFHDSLITLGVFSLLGKEINLQILAAILTIIGYSLNDTIVVFDRIRENWQAYPRNPLKWIIDRSLNDTLSRTILTSVTTLMAVLALYSFAGGVIVDFAFALAIGVVIGTYSSLYVAAPLVIQLTS